MKKLLLSLGCVGALAATVTFTNNAPTDSDSALILTQKRIAAINANTAAMMLVANSVTSGSSSPEGVTTASPGAGFFLTTFGSEKIYIKGVGVGNTNWIQIWAR